VAEKKFEVSLTKLENIVEKLEGEDLSLDESLKAFEEGIRLARLCTHKLNEAEEKIEILMRNAKGEDKAEPFDLESSEGS
jgi:exodeoxyribonuclease VII small subunit